MVNKNIYERMITVIAFLVMIATNAAANLIPLNGVTTSALSNRYPSMLTPAGYTFLIWTIIYLLLFLYVVFQLELFDYKSKLVSPISSYIRMFFVLSCLCNSGWIFAWHYRYIALSLVLIITILVCLSFISQYLYTDELSLFERICIKIPFTVYFGWITVATIVNTSVLLISVRWSAFGLSASFWTIVAALVILLIATMNFFKNRSMAYAATIIWAYAGILVKHTAKNGFNGKYQAVIIAVIICILILFIEMVCVIFKKNKYGI